MTSVPKLGAFDARVLVGCGSLAQNVAGFDPDKRWTALKNFFEVQPELSWRERRRELNETE